MTRDEKSAPGPSGRPRPLALEAFDPKPSIDVALDLLDAAGVPYALAGRLAVWAWVDADEQEFTKDVDFAVPASQIAKLERVAHQRGFDPLPLAIGGFAIRQGQIRIDFIDRHIDFEALYTEAVDRALEQSTVTQTTDGREVTVTPPEYIVAMKLGTGDPRDERDVERILAAQHVDYEVCRRVVRQHLGAAAANRLDHIGAKIGIATAARYVRESNDGSATR